MALLTELPFEAAQKLLKAYDLKLTKIEPLAAGSVNSNFFLEAESDGTEEKKFFARIYEEQGDSGAEFELKLNEALSAADLPVARPVHLSDGRLFHTFEGKPFAVYERLRGAVLSQERVSPRGARAVGRALAQVHTADLGGLEVGPSRFGFPEIEERLARVEAAGRTDLQAGVDEVRALSAELEKERTQNLPSGLIHGDLFRDNVLMGGPEAIVVAGLLDFESASTGPFVYDLMVTVLAWCYGNSLDPFLARAMVEGYASHRALEKSEFDAMASEGSIACVRFASTRLTDFSLRTPEGRKPGRDYRRFIQRLQALRSGALKDALKGMI